jgi:hypothetical protein
VTSSSIALSSFILEFLFKELKTLITKNDGMLAFEVIDGSGGMSSPKDNLWIQGDKTEAHVCISAVGTALLY